MVFAEVGNAQSEWIDRNQFVGHLGLEKEDEVRGVQIPLQLAMVGRRIVDQVEVHARAEGRGLHLLKGNFFYIDIDLGRGSVRDEFLDGVVLAVGVENAVGKLAVEEVQRLREVILNGVAVAAGRKGRKHGGEKIFFRVLGL